MSYFRNVAIAALILASFVAPASANPMDDGILRLGGSTTLLPSASKAASDFMEIYETWDKVDPSLPNKDIVVFVSGGGSSFGVKSVINGTIHIGLASRNIKDKEKTALGEHNTYLVGKDAVVFAVNNNNPLVSVRKGFSFNEIAEIFSGEKKTFQDVDASLTDGEMVIFVRDSGAGSAEMLQKLAMKDRSISENALQLPSQGALLKKLESNTSAMGYISSGLAFGSDELSVFDLEGVTPSNAKVIDGSYGFVRPLLMVVKGKPDSMSQAFIDYMLGDGQKAVEANYYVPARLIQ